MLHEPKNVIPMPGFISLRWVVKKSAIVDLELTNEQQRDIATLHVDAMGKGTEELTEARVDDEVIIIMDAKESIAYGTEDMDVKHRRILVRPKNIACTLEKKKGHSSTKLVRDLN